MQSKGKLVKEYRKMHSNFETLVFSLRLLGLDISRKPVEDEEVWRTSEEGKHFKFETTTGEIKAGFGGKFNGKKIGETWGAGHAKAMKTPSGVGETGKKRYWMHNLPEEKMMEAARSMASIKQSMKYAQQKVDHTKSLWQKGILSVNEMEDALKAQKLDKFDENMSPEEFVMKCRTMQEKKALVDMMSLSKEWDKDGGKMIDENLSDDEKKVVDYFKQKYGYTTQGESSVPEDKIAFSSRWDTLDAEVWMSLKSKAMGGPDSGSEIPDDVLIAAGVKEAPPETAAVPQNVQPNYDWYTSTRTGNLEAYMADVIGEKVSYGHRYSKEEFMEINQRFLDQMKYGKLSPNQACYYAPYAIGSLRDRMGLDGRSTPSEEMLSRLSGDEKKQLLEIVNKFRQMSRFDPMGRFDRLEDVTFGEFENIERKMARTNGNTIRSDSAKQVFRDYAILSEKMLIGAQPSDHNTSSEREKQQKEEAKRQEEAKRAKIRQEQEEFKRSDAAKEKQQAIDRIRAMDVGGLSSPDVSSSDIATAMKSAGFFRPESQFVTDPSIPKQTYMDAAAAYQQVVARFPFLAGELFGFGAEYKKTRSNAGCSKLTDPGSTEIIINYELMKNHEKYQRDREASERMKWHVPVTDSVSAERATITHEIGHAVSNWLHRAVYGEFRPNDKKKGYIIERTYDNEVATLLRDRTMKALGLKVTPDAIKAEVSEYASASRKNKSPFLKSNTTADEFFAECFCELMCSKKPRRAAVEFGRQLDRFIRENHIEAMTSATTPSTMPVLADK